MRESQNKKKEKNKLNLSTTFQVPYTLNQIKEDFSLNTVKKIQATKEEVFAKAVELHSAGKILEAAIYYKDLIDQGHLNIGVLSNYGIILKNLGKLKEAEFYLKKAIKINPNIASIYLNLGAVLKDLGKSKEAEKVTRKCIEINPKNAIAYMNLGNILNSLDKQKEALSCYLKAIRISPHESLILETIPIFLRDSNPSQLNGYEIVKILEILLGKENVYHNDLFKVFNALFKDKLIIKKDDLGRVILDKEFINNKILVKGLKMILLRNLKWEQFLTRLRKYFCTKIAAQNESLNINEKNFIIALAEQCFLNEYVFTQSKEEKESIEKIELSLYKESINSVKISLLACYKPLYKLINIIPFIKTYSSDNTNFNKLLKLVLSEPLQERKLSTEIKKLGLIKDKTSIEVKNQYEESPYPRWKNCNTKVNNKISAIEKINNQIKPNYIKPKLFNSTKKVDVLVAGCGTGEHLFHILDYSNAHFTGIDLSSSSLSYAKRKINELKINNIDLVQMDILEVNLLKKEFDIIECSGVLHHMCKPVEGLKALLGILRKNGLLKIGLYSELARQDIIKTKEYIIRNNIKSNLNDIRKFREEIISGKYPEIQSIIRWPDFYSTSEFRDLCFHAKEHRLTINQIEEILDSHKLKFLGFSLPETIKSLYKKSFPNDQTQTNLQNWSIFEEKYPQTFSSMYQFWVTRTT